MLKAPNAASPITLNKNLILAGTGITHNFSLINNEGALENIGGINTITGNVQLNGNAGIGVEQVDPAVPSQLTITGNLSDFKQFFIRANVLGSSPTLPDTNVIFTGANAGTLSIQFVPGLYTIIENQEGFAPPGPASNLLVYYPATNIAGSQTLANATIPNGGLPYEPPPPPTTPFSTSFITEPLITYGPGNGDLVEIDVAAGGVWMYTATFTPNNTLPGGIIKYGSQRLILQGAGSYTGSVDVAQGALLIQNSSALGMDYNNGIGTGTPVPPETLPAGVTQGNNSLVTTNTTVENGAALEMTTSVADLNGGISAGLQTWNEHLILSGPGDTSLQTVTVTGTSGTFQIVVNGQTTPAGGLAYNATAAQVAAALNALPTVTSGGGFATVTLVPGSGVYTINFLNATNQGLISAAGAGGATAAANLTVYTLDSLAGDNLWRGPVTLKSSATIDVTQNSRLSLFGNIDDGSVPKPAADLTKLDLGELVLAGTNTYRGNTHIGLSTTAFGDAFNAPGGIVTIENGQALGTGNGTTYVTNNSQLQIAGSISVSGESLDIQGSGVGATSLPNLSSSLNWFNIGPAPANHGSNAGNLAVSGSVTGVAVDPTDPNTIYISTAGGGAWKTQNDGLTWSPIFDYSTQASLPGPVPGNTPALGTSALYIGAIAVAPSDPQVLYIGTGVSQDTFAFIGSAALAAPSFYGTGVYKSTDAGKTWTLLVDGALASPNPLYGLAVSKVVVDKYDPNLIYTATSDNVINLPPSAPDVVGIWRFTGDIGVSEWYNLTGTPDLQRSGPATGQAGAIPSPGTPGPEDDYRVSFPKSTATWSDLTLVYADIAVTDIFAPGFGAVPGTGVGPYFDPIPNLTGPPGPESALQPVLYASLGTDVNFGGLNAWDNGVFRTEEPTVSSAAGEGPMWFVGTPGAYQKAGPFAARPAPDFRSGVSGTTGKPGFPTGTWGGPGNNFKFPFELNGNIKITAVVVPTATGSLVNPWEQTNVVLYADVSFPLDPGVYGVNAGTLLEIEKSVDGGRTWITISAPNPGVGVNPMPNNQGTLGFGEGQYASTIIAADQNTVYIGGTEDSTVAHTNQVLETLNGGITWQDISIGANGFGPMTNDHAMALDANDNLILGSDGGVWTYQPGPGGTLGNWVDNNGNLSDMNLEGVAVDPTNRDIAYAGGLANGADVYNGSINGPVWNQTLGGDIGQVQTFQDPTTGQVTIFAVQANSDGTVPDLQESTNGGTSWSMVPNSNTLGNAVAFPIAVDSSSSANMRILAGGPNLNQTVNGGATWSTLNSPIFVSVLAVATYQGLYQVDPAFPPSPPNAPGTGVDDLGANTGDPNTIYISDGTNKVFVTKNGGKSWANRTAGLPATLEITSLTVDPSNRDTVYITSRQFGTDEVWKTQNAGQTWTDITGSGAGKLPDVPAWSVAVDTRYNTVYVGNDNGVWMLPNASSAWQRVGAGMPNVSVRALTLNQTVNTLTAATYGRGVFQLYLDNVQASSGALRAASGQSQWTGPVQLLGDPTLLSNNTASNQVTIVSNGITLQDSTSNASLDIIGNISDYNQPAAINPAGVTPAGATESGNTITITTATPHGYTVGEIVTVSGVGVNVFSITPTGATETGNTVTITTTLPHGLSAGQTVVIAGVGVNAYNGTFTVLPGGLTANQFTYSDGAAPSQPSSGGGTVSPTASTAAVGYDGTVKITSVPSPTTFTYTDPISLTETITPSPVGATLAGNIATITTLLPHGFLVGQQVTITGVAGAGAGAAGYNSGGLNPASFTITSVPTPTSFTYTVNAGASVGTISFSSPTASETGNIVTITTTAANNFVAGESITISSGSVTGFEGTYAISSVTNPTTFTFFTPSTGLGTASPAGGFTITLNSGGGTATRLALAPASGGVVDTGGGFTTSLTSLVAPAQSGASESGNTVTITTIAPHGYLPGQTITLAGVGVVNINAATEAGTTVTITTAAADGLAVGQTVYIAGVALTGYNGTFVVASTPNPTTFTYTDSTTQLTASNGGSVSPASYNGTFTIVNVPSPTTFTYADATTGLAANSGGGTATRPAQLTINPKTDNSALGDLILSGDNTYAGVTDLQQGQLIIHNPNALGASTPGSPTIVESGASLVLKSSLLHEPVQLFGNGFGPFNGHFQGALFNASNNNTYTGQLTMETDTVIGVNSGTTLTIGSDGSTSDGTGQITSPNGGTGGQTLYKEGTGALILNAPNNYAGNTYVNLGALVVQDDNALGGQGATTNVLDGAALWIARNAVLAAQGIYNPTVVSSETLTLSGIGINGTGALQNVQNVPNVLPDDNNPNGPNNNAWLGSIQLDSKPYILLPINPSPNGTPATTPPTSIAIGVSDAKDTLYIGQGIFQGQGSNGVGGTISQNGGVFGLTKVGPGRVTLNQANTYTGGTLISQGELRIQNATALGTTPNGGTTVQTGAALEVDGDPKQAGAFLTVNGQALAISGTGAPNVQTVSLTGSVGGFALSFNGVSTPATGAGILPYFASAITVQNALNALSTISNNGTGFVTVTQIGTANSVNGVTYEITFGGSLAQADQPAILATAIGGLGFLQGNVPVNGQSYPATVLQHAFQGALRNVSGTNIWTGSGGTAGNITLEADTTFQTVTVNGPAGSSFQLSFGGFSTPALAVGSTAGQVQFALNNLTSISGIGGFVSVTLGGNNNNIYTINFGGALTASAPPMILATGLGGASAKMGVLTDAIGVDPATQLTVTSQVTDPPTVPVPAASLSKVANGTLVFPNPNPYSGYTYIDQGVLQIQDVRSLGNSGPEVQQVKVIASGGSFFLSFNGFNTGTSAISASPGGATELGSTATITTTAAHGYTVGESVTITGVGVAGYNGTFTITNIPSPTSFTYTAPFTGLSASGGGTSNGLLPYNATTTQVATALNALSSINGNNNIAASPGGATEVGHTVTITTAAAHGYTVGEAVTIAGVAVAGYNGTFTITSVPSATTFIVNDPTGGLLNSGGGTVTSVNPGFVTVQNPVGQPNVYTITFQGGLGNTNVTQITATGNQMQNPQVSTLNDGPEGTVVNSGATLQVKANPLTSPSGITVALETLTLNGNGFNNEGALQSLNNASSAAPNHNTNTWANTIVLGSSSSIGVGTGQVSKVAVSGTAGGTFSLTVGSSSTPSSGAGALTVTATPIVATPNGASETGNTVTITTTAPHGFQVGQTVTISSVLAAGYNGAFTIATVPSPNTFTYYDPIANLANSGGGNVLTDPTAAQVQAAVAALPSVAGAGGSVFVSELISPTGTATYTIQFGGNLIGVPLAFSATPSLGVTALASTPTPGAGGGASPTTLAITQPITDNGNGYGIIKIGAGTLDYAGTAATTNTYTGLTQVEGGTLLLDKSGGGSALNGPLTIGTGASYNQTTPAIAKWLFNNQMPSNATVTVLSDGKMDLNGKTQVIGALNIVDGVATTGSSGTGILTLSGEIPGVPTLSMTGGQLLIPGTGQVILNGTAPNGNTAGIPDVTATSDNLSGAAVINGSGSLVLGSSTRFFNIVAGTQAVDLDLQTTIVGTGTAGVTKNGTGVLQVDTASNNNYPGTTLVNAGVLQVDGSISGTVELNGGTLSGTNTNGGTGSVGAIIGPPGTGALGTIDPGDNGIIMGTIAPAGASESGNTVTISTTSATGFQPGQLVTISGVGVNGYNGTFVISSPLISSTTFTYFDPTAGLAPSGGGKAIVLTTPPYGILTTNGNQQWGGSTTFFVDLSDNNTPPNPVAGTDYDQLLVNGNLNLNNATLSGSVSPGVLVNDSFTILKTSATGTLSGTFAGVIPTTQVGNVATGGSVFLSGGKFNVIYTYGTNGSVVLQKVLANVSVAVTSTPSSATFGQPVLFTATVTPADPRDPGPIPNGDVVDFLLTSPDSVATIASATEATNTVTVTTTGQSGFVTGETVTIATGVAGYDGSFTIATVSSTSFTYTDPTAGLGNYAGGGTVTSGQTIAAATETGNTVTITSNTPNGFTVGETVQITTGTNYDGQFAISKVISPTQFTYTNPSFANLANYFGGGTITPFTLDSGPVALDTNGQATWDPVLNGPGTTTGGVPLSPTTYGLQVSFIGDGTNYNPASATLSPPLVISQVKSAITGLYNNGSPVVWGQSVTFTATVAGVPASVPPTGTVVFVDTFNNTNTTLATMTLDSNGQAALALPSPLLIGTHTIKVTYSGDADFKASGPTAFPLLVNKDAVNIGITPNPVPAYVGETVSFTASLTAAGLGSGIPTGTVRFYDGPVIGGTQILPSGSLDNTGSFTVSTSKLSLGTHTINVQYLGDAHFLNGNTPSVNNGPSLIFVVSQNPTSTNFSPAPAPNPSGQNQPVSFMVTVADLITGGPTPTGTVDFFMDGSTTPLTSATLNSSGLASTNISFSALGTHTIVAQYLGTAVLAPSSAQEVQTVLAPSTTSASPSPISTVYGQSFTITASVTDASGVTGTPTGTVSYYDNVNNNPSDLLTSTSLSPVSTGLARTTLTTNVLSAGMHTIFVDYTGDNTFGGSGATVTWTVFKASTAMPAVTSSPNPSNAGQAFTVTAAVSVTGLGSGTPTGTVTFFDNGATLGTGTLNGGVATFTTSTLAPGTYTLTATYNGDPSAPNFNTSSSAAGVPPQVVNRVNSSTSFINPVPSTSTFGQTITYVVSVSPSASTLTGETVTFTDNGTSIGTATLNSSGVATFPISTLSVSSSHNITASYPGDVYYTPSNTSPAPLTVNQANTTTTLTLADSENPTPASVSSSTYGETVTIAASVAAQGQGGGIPTGTVSFYDGAVGGSLLGTATLSGGVATFFTNKLSVSGSPHTINAQYNTTSNYAGSNTTTSGSATQFVVAASTSTTISSSAPGGSGVGQAVTFTATVTAQSPGGGIPNGIVTFYKGGISSGNSIGTATVNNSGQAVLAPYTFVSQGTFQIDASYTPANSNYKTSDTSQTSSVFQVVTNASSISFTAPSSPFSSSYGSVVNFSVSVGGTAGPATGTVTFFDGSVGGTTLGTAILSSGVATLPINSLTGGPHTVFAQFDGSGTYAPSSTPTPVTGNVSKATPGVTLTTSGSPSNYSSTVTFTVSVTTALTGVPGPTGSVTFLDTFHGVTSTLTQTALTLGAATYSTSSLNAGTHSISVQYSGDTNFNVGPTGSKNQIVNPAPTTTTAQTLNSGPSVTASTVVTLKATVTPTAGFGIGVPKGTVTWYKESVSGTVTVIGVAALDTSGVATYSNVLPAGSYQVYAKYTPGPDSSGFVNFAGSNTYPFGGFTQIVTVKASKLVVSGLVNGTLTAPKVTTPQLTPFSITVKAETSSGALVTAWNFPATLYTDNSVAKPTPTGGVLAPGPSNSFTVTMSGGVATFSGLTASRNGTYYVYILSNGLKIPFKINVGGGRQT